MFMFLVGIGYTGVVTFLSSYAHATGLTAGAGISTMFLFLDLGVGLGPIFLGMLISSTGYSAMYWLLAGLIVVAGCVYYLVHGRTDAAKGSNLHIEDILRCALRAHGEWVLVQSGGVGDRKGFMKGDWCLVAGRVRPSRSREVDSGAVG